MHRSKKTYISDISGLFKRLCSEHVKKIIKIRFSFNEVTCIDLTICRFQVSVNKRNGRPLVQVAHSPCDLNGPIDENVRTYPAAGAQNPVERSTPCILHDEAEVRILQTDSVQADDVLVLEKPE